jgi:hypothetical protein
MSRWLSVLLGKTLEKSLMPPSLEGLVVPPLMGGEPV